MKNLAAHLKMKSRTSISLFILTSFCMLHSGEIRAEVVYYHSDHLGSSSVLTDELGGISGEMQYYPYGTVFLDTRVDVTPHTYTGQEEDGETGLYYYGARYYDSALGKFASPDPLLDHMISQDLNTYQYARGNPLSFIDPDGKEEFRANNILHLGRRMTRSGIVLKPGDSVVLGDGPGSENYRVIDTLPLNKDSNAVRIMMLNTKSLQFLYYGYSRGEKTNKDSQAPLSPGKQCFFEAFSTLKKIQQSAIERYGSDVQLKLNLKDFNGNVIEEKYNHEKERFEFDISPEARVRGFSVEISLWDEIEKSRIPVESRERIWMGIPLRFKDLNRVNDDERMKIFHKVRDLTNEQE